MTPSTSAEASAPSVTLPFGYAPALLASFFFSVCIIFSRGAYSEPALLMVLLGTLVLVFRFATALNADPSGIKPTTLLLGLTWSGLFGMAFYAWNDNEIIIYPMRAFALGRLAQLLTLLLLLTYLPFIAHRWREPNWARYLRFGLFGLFLTLGGHDVVRASPRPFIDVWVVLSTGAQALGEGKNPYREVAVKDTGPRDAADVPYVYPPTQAYWTLPFLKLFGDVRYAMLAALLIAGAALRFITWRTAKALPSIALDAPTLFIWLSPKLFFILEQSWVDPTQVMFIAVALAAAVAERPLLTAILFGVVLSAKQTMFWFAPLAGVLLRFTLRQWVVMGAVGLAMVLPFVIWDFAALKHANFDFLSALPSRPDALTFTNWATRKFGFETSARWGFVLAAITAGLSLWRMGRTTAGFALAAATTYLFFFVFNKWAFANYYFLLLSLAAMAAAAALKGTASKA